ncbi:MAG: TolC family protein [Deltaproteobacteria bacterium]|nr:TolC family protein [Deltaproteobacteria bacterium]
MRSFPFDSITRSSCIDPETAAPARTVRGAQAVAILLVAIAFLLAAPPAGAEETKFLGAGGATDPVDVPAAPPRDAGTADTASDEAAAASGDEADSSDVTGAMLGLAGEFESEASRKARREESAEYAGAPFPPAGRLIKLSLKEAVEAALAYNLDIVVERYNPLLLDRDVVAVKARLFDPIFDSSINYTDRDTPVASIFFPTGALSEQITEWSFGVNQPTTIGGIVRAELLTVRTDTNSPISSLVDTFEPVLALSISQNLAKNFGWNVNRILLRRSQIGRSQSEEALRQQVINSMFEVESAYWRLVQARETLKVERLGLRLAEDLLRQNQIQVRVGTMAPIDVLQAEAQMKAAETSVIVAENDVRKAQNNLLRLTTGDNRLLTQDVRIETTDEPVFTPREVDFQQSLDTALTRRPDLHVAALEVQDKTLAEKGAKNNLLPSVELRASTGLQGLAGDPSSIITPFSPLPAGAGVPFTPFAGKSSFLDSTSTFFDDDQFSFWSVGLFITYPIGNREARALHARSKLELNKSEKKLTQTEQTATLQVKDVIDTLEASARAVLSTREARRLAEEQLIAEEKKLAVGLSTNFEVLTFQTDLTERRREEIGALTAHKIALSELARATGATLDNLDIDFLKEE